MANAAEELKGPVGFNWQGPASAANYALQNKVNIHEGLTWIDLAIAQNKSFATLTTKSGLLKEIGNTAEAEKIMDEANAIATEIELNNYGYQLISAGTMDKAISILELNTKRFPKSANAWDSLGEAPNVKANSEKYLKQMGAL